jgi:predicted phosphodiesterase
MKLAHISDIHLDSLRNPKCLSEIDHLIKRIFDNGFDHLALTGDIVDVANFNDLYALRDILEKNNVLNWERVSIVPGNHDIFGKYEFSGNGLSATAARVAASSGLGFAKKLHLFCDIFRETITEEREISNYFPFVKILKTDAGEIAIISFSSVLEWSFRRNPVGSRGYIHAEQRHALLQTEVRGALQGAFSIALFHHAFRIIEPKNAAAAMYLWTMELAEKESFLAALQQLGVKIALHGHFHKAEDYIIGGVHFMNSGSVRSARSRINSITIHDDGSYRQAFVKL